MSFNSNIVIVADDEILIRMLAADILTDAGFVVIEVEGATEALSVLEARAADISLLFTDVHMPGAMNGIELAHHTFRHWPWIGLLISSGKARPEKDSLPVGSHFMSKPYRMNELMDHIGELRQ